MYTASLHKFTMFSQIVQSRVFQKLALIVGIVALVGLVAMLNISVESQSSVDLFGSSHVLRTLTRIDDPQYAYEYETRVHAINKGLERLREVTRSDRSYLVVYNYDPLQPGIPGEIHISQTFEVGQEDFPYQLSEFQDFPRKEWLRMKNGERALTWFGEYHPPTTYGLELTNDQNIAIGYVGFEYLQSPLSVPREELAFLTHTAAVMSASLVQSIDQVSHLNQQ